MSMLLKAVLIWGWLIIIYSTRGKTCISFITLLESFRLGALDYGDHSFCSLLTASLYLLMFVYVIPQDLLSMGDNVDLITMSLSTSLPPKGTL